MRLLQLISSHGANGAIMHAVRVSRLLAQHGHQVVAAVLPGSWAEAQLAGVVETVATSFERSRGELSRFVALCVDRRIDASNSYSTRAHNFGLFLSRSGGAPHLAHAQSYHWEFHWLLQRRVVALSRAEYTRQRRWYLRGRNQVAILPNYADTDTFRPRPRERTRLSELAGIASDATVLACVAEIMPRKGQLDLMRALPAVVAQVPSLRVVLFGREGLRRHYVEAVHAEVRRLRLESRVVFAGHRDDLGSLLPQCDAAVLPSHAEPFALGALEAMACGLPLVATDVGGFPDMITPGENGALARAGDPASLAAAILDAIGDEPRRARLAAAARARVERDFSPAGHLARYEAILRGWGIGA